MDAAVSFWGRIFQQWVNVQLDMHQYYGIDMSEPGLLRARSWYWLSARVVGLLSTDRGPFGDGGSRLQRALRPVKHTSPDAKAEARTNDQ